MIIIAILLILAASIAESAVLDPALYLVPSPPLVPTSDSISPGEMWGRSLEERIGRDYGKEQSIELPEETTKKPAIIESRMFWPRFSSPDREPVSGVYIPMTFRISGSYGKVASVPTSVVGSTYTSVAGLGTSPNVSPTSFGKSSVAIYGNYGRSALAGSSYGSYGGGVRVYGSDDVAAWSGWGNGKWGHYGKG